MLRVLLNRPETLRIHEPHIHSVMEDGPAPNIYASGARGSGGTGLESCTLGEENIQKEGLTCAIFTANRDKAKISLELTHIGQCLRRGHKLYRLLSIYFSHR